MTRPIDDIADAYERDVGVLLEQFEALVQRARRLEARREALLFRRTPVEAKVQAIKAGVSTAKALLARGT